MRFRPTALSRALSIALASLAAAGCGGTGQDSGQALSDIHTLEGVAVDGYLARSLVFIDFDNNGTRDASEPYAFTDDNGYFSYNPLSGENYCADEALALFCLQSRRPIDGAVVRIDGGYDVMTGEPFSGQLSRRVTMEETQAGQVVVSPLTTLLTSIRDPEQKDTILAGLGVDELDLNVDYLDDSSSGSADAPLMNTALKLHKVVTVLADRLRDNYDEIGSTVGTPNDLSSSVYKHLAQALIENPQGLNTALSQTTMLQAVLGAAELDARAIYERRDLELPPMGSADAASSRAAQHAAMLPALVDKLIPPSTVASTNQWKGRAKAVETVVIKALQEGSEHDASIDRATEFLLSDNNQALVDAIVESLGDERADLAALVRNDFDGDDFDSDDEVRSASRLPAEAAPFQSVAGKQLRISDMDLGYAPYNLSDSEVEVYFQGETGATSGSFDACIKYIEDAHSDGTLGEANTRGELVHGHWSLLDARQNNGRSYSLLLTIKFLGAEYQAIMKPAGVDTIDGVSYQRVRFDYANEIRTWHSKDGLQAAMDLPLSNEDCKAKLPSRIGL